jgi:hypothetical protein
MALFVSESNISAAWVAGLSKLVAAGGEAVNLTVTIADPVSEIDGVRVTLDEFVAARRATSRTSVEKVSTVANTLFPQSWYRESLGDAAAAHLYQLEENTRDVSHRTAKRGTYFERLVAWPDPEKGRVNQLSRVIDRLRLARQRDQKRGNQYEVGVTGPFEDGFAAPIVIPGHDNLTRGFPCLSHISFSLHRGQVHLTALYRSHDYVSRAYGNYIGLGRVLAFVGNESGWPIGEVTCISSSATSEFSRGGKFGKANVEELLAKCIAAVEAET